MRVSLGFTTRVNLEKHLACGNPQESASSVSEPPSAHGTLPDCSHPHTRWHFRRINVYCQIERNKAQKKRLALWGF